MEIPEALKSPDPLARDGASVVADRVRITVLTDRLLRLEYAADAVFEDRSSLAVVNRRFPAVDFWVDNRSGGLRLSTGTVSVAIGDTGKPFSKANLTARIGTGRNTVEWHFGKPDRANLGGTKRTLDGWRGREYQEFRDVDASGLVLFDEWETQKLDPGLLSRNGWTVVDDSETPVLGQDRWPTPRPDGRRSDVYLFAYGNDHKSALRDAASLFGPQPLPPRFAFGYWYSRYYAYTDRELIDLAEQFDQMAVPLDVMVVDMDWHTAGWTGYSWDKRYFPDPDDTLARLHDRGLRVTLNVHPSDGVGVHEDAFGEMCSALGKDPANTQRIPFDVADPAFMDAYFQVLHHPEEDRGVDFWWMDWQQGEQSAIPGLDPLTWLNHLHWTDQVTRGDDRRPLIFSRWGGLGGGRYPIGFSGDAWSVWETLAFQPEFTASAANVLYGYWSHDIGGHYGPITTPELYTRWLQFGVYSPMVRTHATKHPDQERRFWEFRDPYRTTMIDAVKHRYELVPYVYSECRSGVGTGLSLVRPMYHEHPDAEAAYQAPGQYYFGDSFIVSPVVSALEDDQMASSRVWLPKGKFYDAAHGRMLNVRSPQGEWFDGRYLLDEIPVFAVAGSVVPGQRDATRLNATCYENLVITAYPGADGDYDLYEDDGVSQGYLRGESVTIPLQHRITTGDRTVTLGAASGRYRGWTARRPVEVRFVLEAPPTGVTVNGKPIAMATASDGGRNTGATSYWYFDTDGCSVVVCLGSVDLRRETSVALQRDPRLPRSVGRLLDGYTGLARRLDAIAWRAGRASSGHELHPRERLAVDLAQAANRVTRDPSTLVAELRRVRRTFADLDEILAAWQDAWLTALRFPFSNQEEVAIATLGEARAILATTVEQFAGR